jgi:hypothetical protein
MVSISGRIKKERTRSASSLRHHGTLLIDWMFLPYFGDFCSWNSTHCERHLVISMSENAVSCCLRLHHRMLLITRFSSIFFNEFCSWNRPNSTHCERLRVLSISEDAVSCCWDLIMGRHSLSVFLPYFLVTFVQGGMCIGKNFWSCLRQKTLSVVLRFATLSRHKLFQTRVPRWAN